MGIFLNRRTMRGVYRIVWVSGIYLTPLKMAMLPGSGENSFLMEETWELTKLNDRRADV